MSKITTEDCASVVVANFPAEYGSDNKSWKRVSKSGKKNEPIVRTFHHTRLPLQALVTEVNGAIVDTRYKGLAPWDFDYDTPAGNAFEKRFNTNECFDFIRAHDLFPPSDFCFYVCSEEEADGDPFWYFLAPVASLKREYGYTSHLSMFVQRHLPPGADETEECTFTSELGREETRARLLALGFVSNARFEAQMSGESVDDEE